MIVPFHHRGIVDRRVAKPQQLNPIRWLVQPIEPGNDQVDFAPATMSGRGEDSTASQDQVSLKGLLGKNQRWFMRIPMAGSFPSNSFL
jgi:hypothetical protein